MSAREGTMCRPPKQQKWTPTPPPSTGRSAHFDGGLLRSISGMVLTPVVPGILKSALNGDQARVAMYQADWIFYGSAIQLVIGPVCGAIGDGKLGREADPRRLCVAASPGRVPSSRRTKDCSGRCNSGLLGY